MHAQYPLVRSMTRLATLTLCSPRLPLSRILRCFVACFVSVRHFENAQEGKYVKKFLPVLKNYPPQFVYEPWKASLEDQKVRFLASLISGNGQLVTRCSRLTDFHLNTFHPLQAWGCVIGKDYPAPIVDHAAALKVSSMYRGHYAPSEHRLYARLMHQCVVTTVKHGPNEGCIRRRKTGQTQCNASQAEGAWHLMSSVVAVVALSRAAIFPSIAPTWALSLSVLRLSKLCIVSCKS